jgi:hypothetical protein
MSKIVSHNERHYRYCRSKPLLQLHHTQSHCAKFVHVPSRKRVRSGRVSAPCSDKPFDSTNIFSLTQENVSILR